MARLEVEIGAEVKDLQGKLNQAQKDIQDFSKKADANLGKFSSATNGAGKAVTGMGKSTANAVPAVTEFSRIIQDAPYGMQGVANNLQQLTANFGYLKTSAGGTIPALKLMLSSLAGPAGLLLAVSAVTSAIVYFGNRSQKAAKEAEELAKKKQSLADTTKTYLESLEAVNQANLVGERSAAKELVNLSLLKSQVNDTTLSLDRRKDAVAELRKLYPSYLKDMTDEKILNGGLATVYDTLTGSIKERARATASMNAIIKNTETLLVLESQLAEKTRALETEQKRLNFAIASTNKAAANNPYAVLANSGIAASSTVKQLETDVKALTGEIQNLQLTNIDLEGNIKTNNGVSNIAESIIPKDTAEKVKNKLATIKSDLGLQIQGIQNVFDMTPINMLGSTLTQLDKDKLNIMAKMAELNSQFGEFIEGTMAQTFSNIGQAIGQGLSQGLDVMSMVGEALLNGIGRLISAMGDKLIELGTAAVLAGTVTKLFGSVAGIGAGLAAIAGGIALNAVGAGISNFGGAGNNNSNAGANTSRSNSFSGGFSGGFSQENKVTFVLRGQDLYGAIDNYLSRNGNQGGKLSLG